MNHPLKGGLLTIWAGGAQISDLMAPLGKYRTYHYLHDARACDLKDKVTRAKVHKRQGDMKIFFLMFRRQNNLKLRM